ncbi:MAG: RHS repeat-associated core domain-containing protein, partial [bacterium]
RMEYNPADTTEVFRKYALMRQTVYQGSDSLKTETRTWYNTSNGLPRLIKEQVRPFDTRGYSATPSQVDSYWRSRQIEYAFESHQTGMNTTGTHQLAPVWEEIVREETHSTANGDKTAPIQTTWTTFSQYGSAYYHPHKTWLWTGADAAADTTLPSDPPTNTSEKVVVKEVTSMDAYGHILVEKDGEGRITKYYYGDNSTNVSNAATGLDHRFLTAVRRLAGSSDDNSNDLITETDWDEFRGYKTKETDANDSDTHYVYDDYWRLTHIKNHGESDTLERRAYTFSRDESGDGHFDSSEPNHTLTVKYFTYSGSTDSTHTTVFTDGFGRKIQEHQRNGSNDIITAREYHLTGQVRREFVPYEISNASHDYHNPESYASRDSTKFEYEDDPRRRPYRTTFPPLEGDNRGTKTISYGLDSINGHNFLTRTTTDENNVAHKDWLYADGQIFESEIGGSYDARTWMDVRGLPVMVLPPRTGESTGSSLRTDITQSPVGVEIERGEPDQGTTKTVYDRSLKPIWVQEAADASGDDFWATTYDNFGRETRKGLEKDQSSSWYTRLPSAPTSTHGADADEWRLKYTYDSDPFGSGTTYSKGRLTKVEGNYDTDSTAEYYEWYQYAREGWITKTRTSVAGGVTKDTVYDYDTGGRLRKVTYASGDNYAFYLWYDYDSAGRLHKIYHNTTNSKPGTASAEYAYNARGQITQEKLGGTVQTVDFTYNTRGFLTKINDPGSLGSDRFAMQIGYDDKVANGPSTGWSAEENGNISQIKWINRKFDDNPLYYTFDYNSRDFLTAADNSDDNYDVTYGFDDNGNLSSLDRGTAWTYNYDGDEANTNRVDDITNLTSHDNWDYNLNGHQTKDTNGSFSSATFWFPGAAFHDITMSGGTLEMRYDKNNQRVQKKVAGGTTTNYMRDIRGLVLAVFNSTTISERYVWGPLGIVAIVKGNNSSPTTYYTIKDHLGAVRTVVNTGGTAVAGYDYYPYGLDLRSSVNAGASCRFLFGSKELDTELSLDLYYFEARFYSPEIGRFVSPDPLRIGWSPYPFANNNPLRWVDPTGLGPQDPPSSYWTEAALRRWAEDNVSGPPDWELPPEASPDVVATLGYMGRRAFREGLKGAAYGAAGGGIGLGVPGALVGGAVGFVVGAFLSIF